MSDGLTIHGIPELLRKLDKPEWSSVPMGRFFDSWRYATQRKAVANMTRGIGGWVDTGHTRRSLTSERDMSFMPSWARVGSNVDTARWGEYGTGLLSEDPDSAKRRYFPPPKALAKWSAKHGLNPYLVARSIYRKGGTEPRRFLRDAERATEHEIPGFVSRLANEIEAAASRGT